MKNLYRLMHLLFIIALISCDSEPPVEQQLIGEWMMHKVYDAEKDVTAQHNPEGDRWITFREDGSFESGGSPFGDNKGLWRIEDSVLYIDSDVDDDDSEWNITIKNGETTWTGIGDPRKEGFKLIHRKR